MMVDLQAIEDDGYANYMQSMFKKWEQKDKEYTFLLIINMKKNKKKYLLKEEFCIQKFLSTYIIEEKEQDMNNEYMNNNCSDEDDNNDNNNNNNLKENENNNIEQLICDYVQKFGDTNEESILNAFEIYNSRIINELIEDLCEKKILSNDDGFITMSEE